MARRLPGPSVRHRKRKFCGPKDETSCEWRAKWADIETQIDESPVGQAQRRRDENEEQRRRGIMKLVGEINSITIAGMVEITQEEAVEAAVAEAVTQCRESDIAMTAKSFANHFKKSDETI